ncbi:hypothetical protein JE938_002352 [Flavobacterium psychrophilum]|nr:hypothetical protein [Flavobacterium psychrophilum]
MTKIVKLISETIFKGFIFQISRFLRFLGVLLPTSPRFAGFSRELALEENLAKRVMEEHRAKATMVFHHLRSGGSMEKIVPKGDFFHRSTAWRG